ncbi:DUF6844 domain-containing protein [Halomonas cerina]|uniref:CRISPR/Cas system CSM-associated protein Csm2 small subunit n=1 Tax=Halomonas cerina TaxID=447424 RepID=A0A839VJ50_9GAMM|nr:hypothetical protein [Halomonas cerina]MBB3192406.1 CRISPR/Cas system CSM-associated protein Csm2 small subunit [Halomonas cerina]
MVIFFNNLNHKHVFFSVLFITLTSGLSQVVFAQENSVDDSLKAVTESQDVEGVNELSDSEERALKPLNGEYGSDVEQIWRSFLDERGLREGENDRNVFISSGIATVAMEKGAPGWIESRRTAHDVAFARAKAELVSTMGQKIQQSGTAQFTSNASFGQGQIQEVETVDRTARILDKAGELTEATLDAALREIDPDYDESKYEDMSMPERQVVLENLYEQSTYRSAARVISGATTFRVIEGQTSDGSNHEVLVGMVWSPRLSSLAAAIQDGRTSMKVDGARSSAEDMIPKTVGDAVAAMGTRVFIDDNGDRAVISYAQTEPAQVNPDDQDMARRSALSAAEDLALGQIAAFVGENVALKSSVSARQLTQVYADLVQRGVEIDTNQVQTIRAATGRVDITGANTIWRQVIEHPETQQDIAVVAVVWSPRGQASGERMGAAIDAARAAGTEAGTQEARNEEDASDNSAMTFESQPLDPAAY